jgi:hypothetical protein
MVGKRIQMKSGDEYDALTKARKFHIWKAGQIKKIKRQYNKRFRKHGKDLEDQ